MADRRHSFSYMEGYRDLLISLRRTITWLKFVLNQANFEIFRYLQITLKRDQSEFEIKKYTKKPHSALETSF